MHPRAGLKELDSNAIRVDHVDAAAALVDPGVDHHGARPEPDTLRGEFAVVRGQVVYQERNVRTAGIVCL